MSAKLPAAPGDSMPVTAFATQGRRKDQRVKANWLARVELANGGVAELRVRDNRLKIGPRLGISAEAAGSGRDRESIREAKPR